MLEKRVEPKAKQHKKMPARSRLVSSEVTPALFKNQQPNFLIACGQHDVPQRRGVGAVGGVGAAVCLLDALFHRSVEIVDVEIVVTGQRRGVPAIGAHGAPGVFDAEEFDGGGVRQRGRQRFWAAFDGAGWQRSKTRHVVRFVVVHDDHVSTLAAGATLLQAVELERRVTAQRVEVDEPADDHRLLVVKRTLHASLKRAAAAAVGGVVDRLPGKSAAARKPAAGAHGVLKRADRGGAASSGILGGFHGDVFGADDHHGAAVCARRHRRRQRGVIAGNGLANVFAENRVQCIDNVSVKVPCFVELCADERAIAAVLAVGENARLQRRVDAIERSLLSGRHFCGGLGGNEVSFTGKSVAIEQTQRNFVAAARLNGTDARVYNLIEPVPVRHVGLGQIQFFLARDGGSAIERFSPASHRVHPAIADRLTLDLGLIDRRNRRVFFNNLLD